MMHFAEATPRQLHTEEGPDVFFGHVFETLGSFVVNGCLTQNRWKMRMKYNPSVMLDKMIPEIQIGPNMEQSVRNICFKCMKGEKGRDCTLAANSCIRALTAIRKLWRRVQMRIIREKDKIQNNLMATLNWFQPNYPLQLKNTALACTPHRNPELIFTSPIPSIATPDVFTT